MTMLQPIIFDKNSTLPDKVKETRQELKTWDWVYGQTPEFTNTAETELDWGHVVRRHETPALFVSKQIYVVIIESYHTFKTR